MAEFRKMVVTDKGQALIAKMLSSSGRIEFTKISVSDATYTDEQIITMTSVEGVKQTANISKRIMKDDTSVQVEGAIDNTEVQTGYNIKTIVLHAYDPDEGEIVYAGCGAIVPGWMPPFNGVSSCGAYFKLVTKVSNADNVNLEVDPGAVATIGDIQHLQDSLRCFTRKNLLINGDFLQDTSREGWWEARETELWTLDCWKAKNCDVEFTGGVAITGIEGAEGYLMQWLNKEGVGYDLESQNTNVYTFTAMVNDEVYSVTANNETVEKDFGAFKLKIERVLDTWDDPVFCVKIIPKGTNTIYVTYADLYEGSYTLPHRVEGYEELQRRCASFIAEGTTLAPIYRKAIGYTPELFSFGITIPKSISYSDFRSLTFKYLNSDGVEVTKGIDDVSIDHQLGFVLFTTNIDWDEPSDDCHSVLVDYLIDGQSKTEPTL